jgi:hypothetical protein
MAVSTIARASTWEALQADAWSDEDLAKLQDTWASQDFAGAMVAALEGERIYADISFPLLRRSNETTTSLFYPSDEYGTREESDRPWWERNLRKLLGGHLLANFVKRQVYGRIWRFAWSFQDQQHYIRTMHRLIQTMRSAAASKSWASIRPAIEPIGDENAHFGLYDRLRYPCAESFPSIFNGAKRAMRAETERSMTICAIALKRYRLRHGDLPASLGVLVPEFLSSVPIDYMDGKPLRYRLNSDGTFLLYSVGEDGIDDGGSITALPGWEQTRNPWNKKDFVWPAPALPEELEAYRNEAAKN